jgi:hypothetical protein
VNSRPHPAKTNVVGEETLPASNRRNFCEDFVCSQNDVLIHRRRRLRKRK